MEVTTKMAVAMSGCVLTGNCFCGRKTLRFKGNNHFSNTGIISQAFIHQRDTISSSAQRGNRQQVCLAARDLLPLPVWVSVKNLHLRASHRGCLHKVTMTGGSECSHKHHELVEVHLCVSVGVQVLEQFVHSVLVLSTLETETRVSDTEAPGSASARPRC